MDEVELQRQKPFIGPQTVSKFLSRLLWRNTNGSFLPTFIIYYLLYIQRNYAKDIALVAVQTSIQLLMMYNVTEFLGVGPRLP